MLDEPTNLLDIESVAWLEDYLCGYEGAIIVVSHDRAFLNSLTNRTLHVSRGRIDSYAGNYDFFEKDSQARRSHLLRAAQNQQKAIEKAEKFIERFRYKATKAAQVQSRVKALDKIERFEVEEEDVSKISFRFPEPRRCGQVVLEVSGVNKAFGGHKVLGGISFRIERGEKVALVGVNGAGKSTLAKIIAGELPADSGTVSLGLNVGMSYFAQHQSDELDRSNDVLTEALNAAPLERKSEVRGLLGAFLFKGDDVFKRVSVLSGGEQSRLRLCMLMDESINLLILDEPTNHLDIDSREWLEQAVEAFDGTLLFVSHDRYFINRFATRVWELAGGVITDYPMGFAQYRQAKEEEHAAAAAAVQVQSAAPKKNGSRGNRAQQAAKKQLTICETAIARLEADSARLEAEMAENACDAEKLNALYQEQQDVQKRLEQEMERWEELSLQAEEQEER